MNLESMRVILEKIKEYDKNLQAGQIRLLPNVKELTYVLLLNSWGEEAYVITAFSHYAEPATNEELLIDAEAGLFLNTLQIWTPISFMCYCLLLYMGSNRRFSQQC